MYTSTSRDSSLGEILNWATEYFVYLSKDNPELTKVINESYSYKVFVRK